MPNERDNANTVRLQVFFPSNLPLLTVNVLPIPGWSAKVETQTLSKPVQTDDGPVDQVVTNITWTATSGGITPGQYQDFDVSAGKVPDRTGTVVFKSLQTYSSGEDSSMDPGSRFSGSRSGHACPRAHAHQPNADHHGDGDHELELVDHRRSSRRRHCLGGACSDRRRRPPRSWWSAPWRLPELKDAYFNVSITGATEH